LCKPVSYLSDGYAIPAHDAFEFRTFLSRHAIYLFDSIRWHGGRTTVRLRDRNPRGRAEGHVNMADNQTAFSRLLA
jgi:hypothetical protein